MPEELRCGITLGGSGRDFVSISLWFLLRPSTDLAKIGYVVDGRFLKRSGYCCSFLQIPMFFHHRCTFAFASSLLVWGAITLGTPAAAHPEADALAQVPGSFDPNSTLSVLEYKVLQELNRARTNPRRYALWLEGLRGYYSATEMSLPGENSVITQEGLVALDEAIAVLRTLRPALPLEVSPNLSQSAQGLVNQATSEVVLTQEQGIFAQSASGFRSPLMLVAKLIIDDGNRDRSRRQALFDVGYRSAGIACRGGGEESQQNCIVSYAGSLSDRIPTTLTLLPPPATPPEITIQPTPPDETIDIPVQPAPSPEITLAPQTPSLPPELNPLPPPESTNGNPLPELTQPTSPPPTNPQIASLINPDPQSVSQGFLLARQGELNQGSKKYEDGSLYNEYLFEGQSGQLITIRLTSDEFDTFLALFDNSGTNVLSQNDDADGESNSRITITLPYSGVYRIFVNGYGESDLGNYTLTIR